MSWKVYVMFCTLSVYLLLFKGVLVSALTDNSCLWTGCSWRGQGAPQSLAPRRRRSEPQRLPTPTKTHGYELHTKQPNLRDLPAISEYQIQCFDLYSIPVYLNSVKTCVKLLKPNCSCLSPSQCVCLAFTILCYCGALDVMLIHFLCSNISVGLLIPSKHPNPIISYLCTVFLVWYKCI